MLGAGLLDQDATAGKLSRASPPIARWFLHDRRKLLLDHAPRFKEAEEMAAFPRFRDMQVDRPVPGFSFPVAIPAVPARRVLLDISRARRSPDLQLHQPFGGKTDHLA